MLWTLFPFRMFPQCIFPPRLLCSGSVRSRWRRKRWDLPLYFCARTIEFVWKRFVTRSGWCFHFRLKESTNCGRWIHVYDWRQIVRNRTWRAVRALWRTVFLPFLLIFILLPTPITSLRIVGRVCSHSPLLRTGCSFGCISCLLYKSEVKCT